MTALTPPPLRRTAKVSTLSESMGDLLRRLGDISPDRVRMHPAPGSATEADVIALDAHGDGLFELIDGILVEKGMGFWESILAGKILVALDAWVAPRNLGVVSSEAGMMRLFPGRVRIPDVAYISRQQLSKGHKRQPIPDLYPDLAVEVLSDTNTKSEMKLKRRDYFKAGTRLVWEFDAEARTVTVYTASEKGQTFRENQSLDGGEVLPGFKLPLKKLFAALDQ